MKKFLLIGLMITSPALYAAMTPEEKYADDRDKFFDALEESDPINVKKYLRRLNPTAEEKDLLVYAAEDVLDEKEAKLSLTKSKRDLAWFVAGLILFGGSWLAAIACDKKIGKGPRSGYNDERLLNQLKMCSRFFKGQAVVGGGLALSGFLCRIAKNRVTLAQKVLKEVMDTKVKGEYAKAS